MDDEKIWIIAFISITIAVIITIGIILGVAIKQEIDYGEKEGFIVDKSYHSAYTTMVRSGKITVPQYHPEEYQFKLKKEVENKEMTIWISVDRDTYHNYKVGDYYDLREN